MRASPVGPPDGFVGQGQGNPAGRQAAGKSRIRATIGSRRWAKDACGPWAFLWRRSAAWGAKRRGPTRGRAARAPRQPSGRLHRFPLSFRSWSCRRRRTGRSGREWDCQPQYDMGPPALSPPTRTSFRLSVGTDRSANPRSRSAVGPGRARPSRSAWQVGFSDRVRPEPTACVWQEMYQPIHYMLSSMLQIFLEFA